MTWFEKLTGFREGSREQVHRNLTVEGTVLRSFVNGQSWTCGELDVLSLSQLRELAQRAAHNAAKTSVRELVADVQQLHRLEANAGAVFQVASQFNLLEMVSQDVTPEDGVGIYEHDRTQGPACAIAAGAGTIFRNYFAPVNGQLGQTADNQIDCLADLGSLLGNTGGRLWRMQNGYALATAAGLAEISGKLAACSEQDRDRIRQALRVGIQRNTQVTLDGASQLVSQVYCSALPVAYSRHSSSLWKEFATLVLEGAYEATLCAAIHNRRSTGNNRLLLTLLGGGAFGNELSWIAVAMRRAIRLYRNAGLDIAIVSYGSSKPFVRQLAEELNAD